MKLLFDENLSPELPRLLADAFPDCAHIRRVNLAGADDADIWQVAAVQGYTLVTKDDDFLELSILRGAPPKVIMIRLGNCRTSDVVALFNRETTRIGQFDRDTSASLLEIP